MRVAAGYTLKPRKDGIYVVGFYVDARRRRISTGTRDPEAAGRKAAEIFLDEHRRAGVPAPAEVVGRLTLEQIAAKWIADLKARADEHAPDYADVRETYVAHYFAPRWDFVGDVTEEGWKTAMREIRDTTTKRRGPTSWQTIQHVAVALRAFLEFAHALGAIAAVPTIHGPDSKLIEAGRAPRRSLSEDERDDIFAAMKTLAKKDPRFGEALRWLLVAFYSAMRKGEINHMTARWADFRGEQIEIPARFNKSRKPRWIDLHPKAAKAIREQIAARKLHDLDAPVFQKLNHRRAFYAALKAAGVDPHGVVSAHTARHTRLTQIGAAGGKEALLAVMSQAGHSNPATSGKYLHPAVEHARRANRRAR